MVAKRTPLDNGAFKARLAAGETVHGIFSGLASPMAAEVAAAAGADFVLLDLEHGGGGEEQVGPTVVATGAYGVPTLVRVETGERIRIGRALDSGAAGIMVPRITSATEAEDAIAHFHYPPFGDRGVASYNRAAAWGMNPAALDGRCTSTAIVQIETLGALADVERIAAIEGVDVLFVGPLDLSYALGAPRDFTGVNFVAALEKVVSAAKTHGVTPGILAGDLTAAKRFMDMGFRFIAHSSDSVLLARSVTETLKAVR